MYSRPTKIGSEAKTFNFGYLLTPHTIYMSKDVNIPGYFLNPKVVHEQNLWDTLLYMMKNCFMHALYCKPITW
jgi:hypothetical protein